MPDVQTDSRAWRSDGRTGHHQSAPLVGALHTCLSEIHNHALFCALAGQSSSAVHLPVLRTGESGLTASAPGAMVIWLDTRHMDDNA